MKTEDFKNKIEALFNDPNWKKLGELLEERKKEDEGVWRIKGGEILDDDSQDTLNKAMDILVNENGETLREAMDRKAALLNDDGSGDKERKLTKDEMDIVMPKFINKLSKNKEND